MLLLFPPKKGFFALYIQARQGVLGHERPRSCDAICHIWSWSCFGTHRPLFPDHILQDQGSPRSKTLSITNLRSGADISLADKSNPIWSKLTALHRFLCEFSLVWWVGEGSKDMTKPWGWGKNSFLGQCWSRHLLKATFFATSPTPSHQCLSSFLFSVWLTIHLEVHTKGKVLANQIKWVLNQYETASSSAITQWHLWLLSLQNHCTLSPSLSPLPKEPPISRLKCLFTTSLPTLATTMPLLWGPGYHQPWGPQVSLYHQRSRQGV